MGQQVPRRYSHTQEIAVGPSVGETHTMSRGLLEDLGAQEPRGCRQAVTPPCCAVDDSACSVEEILVVHHDALRKVNYLLKADDLTGCDMPSVPECVVAARRAELHKRHQQNYRELKRLRSGPESPGASDLGHVGPCGPVCSAMPWDDESDSHDDSSTGPGRRGGPSLQPSLQPTAREDDDDLSDLDGCGAVPPPSAELPPQPVSRPAIAGAVGRHPALGAEAAPAISSVDSYCPG